MLLEASRTNVFAVESVVAGGNAVKGMMGLLSIIIIIITRER